MTDLLADTERQLRENSAFDYMGDTIVGQVDTFPVTRAGLIAAGHREGARGTRNYLRNIANHGFTSRGLRLNTRERAIEQRLREFVNTSYE